MFWAVADFTIWRLIHVLVNDCILNLIMLMLINVPSRLVMDCETGFQSVSQGYHAIDAQWTGSEPWWGVRTFCHAVQSWLWPMVAERGKRSSKCSMLRQWQRLHGQQYSDINPIKTIVWIRLPCKHQFLITLTRIHGIDKKDVEYSDLSCIM